ncbi:DNA polymerase IV [Nocardioides baekrokdamisoli]|uniref:DNA polymerase IV n=1 Tax=Nocardioides baekrokdamisoli TaxID=1804624 RepID=A0A3G9ID01_9ACTN|nr:DNA polymerase IV [Nocardioides baekrokdamisoli]BBH16236.1 DNA polymerase IV [Nocardioides baekrokdamisoli]
MRSEASVMHLDLDAFYASVEQRDKPSLRGKAVIVGGTGNRGVVSTASYEARVFGVRSAMSIREARARCPHAAFLVPRFRAYQEASRAVMKVLAEVSETYEPLSLDEAFVDLADANLPDLNVPTVTAVAEDVRAAVREATGGLTASVGLASSKFLAKIASDMRKPDGLMVIEPGTEQELLRPLPVGVIPGIGPATRQRLSRVGIHTVADLELMSEDELVSVLGASQGQGLYRLARAEDDRRVHASREAKSVSVEGTYDTDIADRTLLRQLLSRQAGEVARRLQKHGLSGRTISIKVRQYDFTTVSRSATLPEPTDAVGVITRLAQALLEEVDTDGGVRLLGVGVSGLADWVQEDLFGSEPEDEPEVDTTAFVRRSSGWHPGQDVIHSEYGPGWVWGSGRGVVTVRFETALTGPGPVHSFKAEDAALSRPDESSS